MDVAPKEINLEMVEKCVESDECEFCRLNGFCKYDGYCYDDCEMCKAYDSCDRIEKEVI